MLEVLTVTVLIVLVGALGWLSPEVLFQLGIAGAALGLFGSLWAGFRYHLRLYRWLAMRGTVPARWWWAPSRYHAALDAEGRQRVIPPFRAGVLLLSFSFLGFLFVTVAAIKAYWLAR